MQKVKDSRALGASLFLGKLMGGERVKPYEMFPALRRDSMKPQSTEAQVSTAKSLAKMFGGKITTREEREKSGGA